ncbi:hypothetical protein Dimus_036335 [Dionaea muscipula]
MEGDGLLLAVDVLFPDAAAVSLSPSLSHLSADDGSPACGVSVTVVGEDFGDVLISTMDSDKDLCTALDMVSSSSAHLSSSVAACVDGRQMQKDVQIVVQPFL